MAKSVFVVLALFAAGVALAPAALGLSAAQGVVAAIALVTIGLWATGLLAEHLTSLTFFAICSLLAIAPQEVIFAGFGSSALWLVFGGLIIGSAVGGTGLGKRLAGFGARYLPNSYRWLVHGVVMISFGFAFLMPSTIGRMMILLPIVMELAESAGYRRQSHGWTALVLASAMGTLFPPFAILPANVPPAVLFGAMDTLYGITPTYFGYLVLHLPVLGVVKAVVIGELLVRLFPDADAQVHAEGVAAPMSAAEKRLAAILALALAFWASDALHGIAPGWIALGAAVLCLLPGIGVMPASDLATRVNLMPAFYVAGVLGLGAVLADSGIGEKLSAGLMQTNPFIDGAVLFNAGVLTVIATGVGMLTTLPGIAATLTPLAGSFTDLTGLPLMAVLMTQVIAFSATMLPYQSPPLMVAFATAGVPLSTGTRAVLPLGIITLVVLMPLQLLWWRLIGFV
ncbi:MAG: SLC13 family permease [Geminicoccaceae bacterium]